MASIHPRGNSFGVSYTYKDEDGVSCQKQETYTTLKAAEARKKTIEYEQSKGIFSPPVDKTVQKFLEEFIDIYGSNNWSPSTYSTNTGQINNYIVPTLGKTKLKHLNKKKMDAFFTELADTKRVPNNGKPSEVNLSNKQIKEIHVLLTTAFNLAVEWGDLGKNPITKSSRPKVRKKQKIVLDPKQARYLLTECKDIRLLACLCLAIGCSMREGEIVGLRWPQVNFGDIENDFENAYVDVNAELQRVDLEALSKIKARREDIIFTFPSVKKTPKSKLVLKTPKTDSSIRRVWIPRSVSKVLWYIRKEQDKWKEFLGEEYQDYDLVITRTNGRPIEHSRVLEMLQELLEKIGLPRVDFHSLRHTSTTIKLLITNGDIKSVQGDNGQNQAKMVTDTYSFIIDSNRQRNAVLIEEQFFKEGSETNNNETAVDEQIDKMVNILTANPGALNKLMEALSLATNS